MTELDWTKAPSSPFIKIKIERSSEQWGEEKYSGRGVPPIGQAVRDMSHGTSLYLL
jgi:hypothetical protein